MKSFSSRSFGDLTYSQRQALVQGYDSYIKTKMESGYIAYFVNFMFCQLPGSQKVQWEIMANDVRRCHEILTPHVVRKSKSEAWKPLRPILIGCPDAGTRRKKRKTLRPTHSIANDGWHFNGIILVPPRRRIDGGGQTVAGANGRQSRLKIGLIRHFRNEERKYLTRGLERIHVTRIRHGTMIDYAFKTFKAGRFSDEQILIL